MATTTKARGRDMNRKHRLGRANLREAFKVKAATFSLGGQPFPEKGDKVRVMSVEGKVEGLHEDYKDGIWVKTVVVTLAPGARLEVVPIDPTTLLVDPKTGEILQPANGQTPKAKGRKRT
jgi:hypothetical protein